jgi:hypothetical protein
MPLLARGYSREGRATEFYKKADLLRAQLFLPPLLADLDDILGLTIPFKIEPAPLITAEMVQTALYCAAPFKAPSSNSIPMGFLQAIRKLIVLAL